MKQDRRLERERRGPETIQRGLHREEPVGEEDDASELQQHRHHGPPGHLGARGGGGNHGWSAPLAVAIAVAGMMQIFFQMY